MTIHSAWRSSQGLRVQFDDPLWCAVQVDVRELQRRRAAFATLRALIELSRERRRSRERPRAEGADLPLARSARCATCAPG